MNPERSPSSGPRNKSDNRALTTVLEELDKLANGLGSTLETSNDTIKISRTQLAFQVVLKNPCQFSVIAENDPINGAVSLTTVTSKPDTNFQNSTLASFDAKGLTNCTSSNSSIIYSYFFRKPTLFPINYNKSNNSSIKSIVGSAVLAVTIKAIVDQNKLNKPINLTFEKSVIEEGDFKVGNSECKYWNETSGLFVSLN